MSLKKKEYKLSFGRLLLIMLVAAFLGAGLMLSASNVAKLLFDSAPEMKETLFLNLFDKNKELPVSTEKQIIKVVNEESQIIEVVKKASPAVVSIVATAEVPKFDLYYRTPFGDLPEELQRFFDFSFPEKRQKGTEKVRVGAGSGFLVSQDGYIITNKHVVGDENAQYTVFLNDEKHKGEKIIARVIARNPNNDLAVMKIEMTDLPFLEFSDSDNLQVGQTAITIGYAMGEYENTVSRGVVSGLSRSVVASGVWGQQGERLRNLIQTDAAINPGNSGGPMLDISAKVIGVNVAMANAENIGFAILGNTAKATFEEVKATGKIKEIEGAFLGVRYISVTEALKENNNLPYDYGALIVRGETRSDLAVIPGSPADKAGLMENDIILEVEGEKVTERNQLFDLIGNYKPGDEVELLIYHKGEEKKVKVKLGKE